MCCVLLLGKWLEGEVVGTLDNGNLIRVHYNGWDPKWDEWISVKDESQRLAECHQYSADRGKHQREAHGQ